MAETRAIPPPAPKKPKPKRPPVPKRKPGVRTPGSEVYWRALDRFEDYAAWRIRTDNQSPHPASLVDFIIEAIDESLVEAAKREPD